jgi:hypothetical protein
MNREKFAIGCSIVSAIRNANAMYCALNEDEEYSDAELNEVAEKIKKDCSKSMIEDLAIFLHNHCLPLGVEVGDILAYKTGGPAVKVISIKQGMVRYTYNLNYNLSEDERNEKDMFSAIDRFTTLYEKIK